MADEEEEKLREEARKRLAEERGAEEERRKKAMAKKAAASAAMIAAPEAAPVIAATETAESVKAGLGTAARKTAAGAGRFGSFMRDQHEATKGHGGALFLFGILFWLLDWLLFGFNNSPQRVIFYCAASIIFYIYLYSGQRNFMDVLGLICIFLTVFFLLPVNPATFGLAAAFFAAALFIFIKQGMPRDVIVISALFLLCTALPTLVHFYPKMAELPLISLVFVSALWPWYAIYGLFRMENNFGNVLKVLFIIYLVVFFIGGVAFKGFYHEKFVTPQQQKYTEKGFTNVREAVSTLWKWTKAGLGFITGHPEEWEKLQNETKQKQLERQKQLQGVEEKAEPIIVEIARDRTAPTTFAKEREDVKAMTELKIKGPLKEIVIVDVSCYIEDTKNKKNITGEVNLKQVTKSYGEREKIAKLICRSKEPLVEGTYRFVFKIIREDIESEVSLVGLYYYSKSQFNIEETREAKTIISKTYPQGIVSKAYPPNEQAVGIIDASISQQSPVTRIEQGAEIPVTLAIKNIGTGLIKTVDSVMLTLPKGMRKAEKFCEAFIVSGRGLMLKQEILKKINYEKAKTGQSITFASCNVKVDSIDMPPNKIDRKIFFAQMVFTYVLEQKVNIEVT